jgi:hypothetical protein
MKVLKYLLIAVAILCLGVFIKLVQAGLFTTLAAQEQVMGPYSFVYTPFVGDYRKVTGVYRRIHASLKDQGITIKTGLTVFYDDYRYVPRKELRSDVGFVLEEKDLARLPEIEKLYKSKIIPAKESVVTEFPIKNFLSYMVGHLKAYPFLKKYAADKNLKTDMFYEVYDSQVKKIYYALNLAEPEQPNEINEEEDSGS